MSFVEKYQKKMREITQFRQQMPRIVANECVKFFADSFDKGGWNGNGFAPWKPRKTETKKSSGKKILVSTGALRRAVIKSVKSVTADRIEFKVDLPYAKVHNEGGSYQVKEHKRRSFAKSKKQHIGVFSGSMTTQSVHGVSRKGTVKSHKRNYPQRKFMGDSNALRTLVRKKILDSFRTIVNG